MEAGSLSFNCPNSCRLVTFCLRGKMMMMEGVVCRMFMGTWNVGGKSSNEGLNLRDWLMLPSPTDVYAIGYIIIFILS